MGRQLVCPLESHQPERGFCSITVTKTKFALRFRFHLVDPKNEQFTGWTVRVLLEPLKLERPDIRDIGGDDVDFTITDIAEH